MLKGFLNGVKRRAILFPVVNRIERHRGERMSERRPSDSRRQRDGARRSSLTIQIGSSTIFLVIGLVAAAYLLFRIPHFWLIVLTAVVFATAMDKPVAAMQARGVPRAAGIFLILVLLVGFLAGALAALVPIISGDARALEAELPAYVGRFEQAAAAFLPGAETGISLASLEQAARSHAASLAQGITEIGVEAGRTAFYVFVTLVVTFFLAVEPNMIVREAARWVPLGHRARIARVALSIHERIGAWARGQLLIAIIFGALMGAGLRLIGVPYAWSLGAVAGILEVIPYVGGVITVVLALFSAATVGIPQVIGVLVLYVILVNLESHVLAPLLYGRALGFPPVAILLSLLAGVELLGILGALLAVPLTVIVWAVVDEFAPRQNAAAPAMIETSGTDGSAKR